MTSEVKIPKKRRRRAASLDKRKARSGYLFVAPFILGIILIYIPILLDSLWLTFFKTDTDFVTGITTIKPLGLEIYTKALVDDPEYVTSLIAGLQQILFQVPAIIIFALFIAVVLNQKMLGRAAFRAIFFVPVIISTGLMDSINASDMITSTDNVAGDDGSGGGSNQIISVLDVEKLFGNMKVGGQLVTYVVQLVNDIYNIINYSGVQMLIFLAGLQSICRIDGATGWETFWKVTFPMISPMILVNAVYTTIDAFTRTTNPTMQEINNTFTVPDFPLATAMSWIYFIVVLLIIAVVAGIASTFIFYQRKD